MGVNGRRETHAARAYSHLRSAILNRELRPGDPILEVEIANRLQMSRTPVREAVHRLMAEGLVQRARGLGTFVKKLSNEEIRLVYEYAEGLEGMVSFLIAQNYRPEIGARLMESVSAMEAAVADNDIDAWTAADAGFHASLYEFCPNRVIVQALDEKVHRQVDLVRITLAASLMDRGRSTADHRAAAEAIMAGDPYRARDVTQRHWERIRNDLVYLTA